jgi:hypothetical protein
MRAFVLGIKSLAGNEKLSKAGLVKIPAPRAILNILSGFWHGRTRMLGEDIHFGMSAIEPDESN